MSHKTGIRGIISAVTLLSCMCSCAVDEDTDSAERMATGAGSVAAETAEAVRTGDAIEPRIEQYRPWHEKMSRDEARRKLLGHMRPAAAHIRVGVGTWSDGGAVFSRERFARAVEDVTGVMVVGMETRAFPWDMGGLTNEWTAASELHDIVVTHDFRVRVRSDRNYEPGDSSQSSDDKILEEAEQIMLGYGASPSELGDPYFFKLGVAGRPEDAEGAENITNSALAKMVRYNRSVGGIPVQGNRMTLGFHLDGTFREMRGTWPPINYSSSDLSTNLTADEIQARGIDLLLDTVDDLDDALSVSVSTFYEPSLDGSGDWVLDLQARAAAYFERGPERISASYDPVFDI